MSFLGKLLKGAKRLVKNKIVSGFLTAGANAVTGGLAGKALSVAKTLGARIHGNKVMKQQSKATGAAIAKLEALPKLAVRDSIEEGEALPGMPNQSTGITQRKARRKKSKAPAKKAAKSGGGGKRKPPAGGIDLKALSASWKAAGKPGKWIDWVKQNGKK